MIPVERHQQILALVSERGVVSIAELTERLGVSHMTIRRDLQKLEEQGAVQSVSGGVQAPERVASEPSHQAKEGMFSRQKIAIGRLAARQIPANSCIYLDAGTTTLALAKQIGERDDLTVVTNDFVIAGFLIEHSQCRIIHTGGTVCRENRSCVGEAAAQALRGLFIDLAFISASSWSMRGLSTPNEDKVMVKKAIVEASRRRILLSDTSKYGKVATYLALPIAAFDAIITDEGLPAAAREAIEQAGIALLTAEEEE
ncbi:DeoR/GlpR transcriptional regulator [Serratia sp. SRS-8-S-2018]|uniref:DNA-binding transcriptional repressor YgbI n=1 Tax=Serratia TaxID=613 RepID=UPI000976CB31|nr:MULTISPECIES: DNA-binding transcriptional repressor YgbI [Serratia]ASC77763.1 DeoR family transcriptional regulator [Serratia marcescens]EIT7186825.1 DeoR/GlpR transcriptional regulator [Serratia marcescens]EJC6392615.1 DeoR/GlpR transcriptional regulator [Serratia marcescens]MDY7607605.1 DNA-binding transcriptional repressor YgbI [Serratia marcescens]OMP56139.1 DeoR family transcriptional regulator [Serratia marcescens]